jgi:hypothetical protein
MFLCGGYLVNASSASAWNADERARRVRRAAEAVGVKQADVASF